MNKLKQFNILDYVRTNLAWAMLIVISIIFSFFSTNFFTMNNIVNIMIQNAYIVVAALGISFIMMSGSLDLSVGFQMSANGVICALLLTQLNLPVWSVLIIAIVIGMLLSLMNTLISLKLNIPIFMVSLGTMTIYQGVSYVISESKAISGFPESFKFLGQGYIYGVSFPVIIVAVLFIIVSFILNKTYLGRYVYALGGNPEAARLAGIDVVRMRLLIAVLSGGFIGLSAMMLISRMGTAMSGTGPGTEFTVITGVLLGGVSIRGGEGKLSGVLAGILILAILSNGMQLAGLNIYYQFIAKGVIMLIAIGFDVYQINKRQTARNARKVSDHKVAVVKV
jgi:ribose/xylose/arabinose/galactoside ABC-type transport system permease subunit